MKKSKDQGTLATSQGLYAPFRDLGLICDDVKFAFSSKGGVCYIICSIGCTFHIYSLEKLELVFVGPRFDQKITCLAAFKDITFAATENVIHVVERNVEIAKIQVPSDRIESVSVLGEFLVASGQSKLYVFDLKKYELLYSESFEGRLIIGFLHPETYLNKIVIGFADGELALFNIKSKKTIHLFTDFSGQRLTSLVASPDPDIIVCGFASGNVSFLELRKAQVLFTLKVEGSVAAMAFRTDELAHLAVGSARGEVYIFDLDSRKLEHIMAPHAKSVSTLWFVPQQPLLVTASGDNSIKEFLFESSEYRLLRSRSGHYKPPTNLQFLGEDSRFLVSSGADKSLRFFSTLKDNQNFEFSQGSTQKIAAKLKVAEDEIKLPAISAFDIFQTKTLKWDNMVTAHTGQAYAKTWRLDRKTIGEHTLETADKSTITDISMSACGNFALLSTFSGNVEVFNVQSGIRRKTLQVSPGVPVVAAYTDATSSLVLAISQSGIVKQYAMSSAAQTGLLDLSESGKIVCAAVNRDTELIAVGAESKNVIKVIDYSAMQVVRVFTGHAGLITDLTFSSDSKWLLSAGKDCTIRTWDLPTGNMIDVLKTTSVPVSLALSRNLEFLASAQEDEIHICLWSNRSLYTGDCNIIESALTWSSSEATESQASNNEVCYSAFPASRWKNIFFLEKIRSNTKPVTMASATSKRPALPFFLTQALEQDKKQILEQDTALDVSVSSEEFVAKLAECTEKKQYAEFFKFLLPMNPSKIDFELSSLGMEEMEERLSFILSALLEACKSGQNFELVQAIISLVLRHHERFISEKFETFNPVLTELSAVIKEKWSPLEALLQRSICLTAFAREH